MLLMFTIAWCSFKAGALPPTLAAPAALPCMFVSLQLGPFFDYAAAMVLLCFVQAELFTILRPLHCCGP